MRKIIIAVAAFLVVGISVFFLIRNYKFETYKSNAAELLKDSAYSEAFEMYGKALKIKKDTSLILEHAFLAIELNKKEALNKDIQLLEDYEVTGDKFFFLKGVSYFFNSDYQKAINLFKKNKDFNEKNNKLYIANSYKELGKDNLEIKTLKNYLNLDSLNSYVFYRIGVLQKDSFLLKKKYLTRALNLGFDSLKVLRQRDGVLDSLGLYEKAVEDYDFVYKKEGDTSVLSRKASLNYKTNNYIGAINDYSELIRMNPENYFYYYKRGNSYVGEGEFGKSISDFNQALSLNPKNNKALYNRALAYMKNGSYEKAAGDFSELVKREKNSGYYKNLGICYLQIRRIADAREALDKAIEIENADPESYYYKGMTFSFSKQFKEAISLYNMAIERNDQFGAAYFNRGVSKISKSDFKDGCKDIIKSKSLGVKKAEDMLKNYCKAFR